MTNQWLDGRVGSGIWALVPILSTHYSTAEAVRDSNCLHLHKSIDLSGLQGCPVVSIHLWMHAYSKLQCPKRNCGWWCALLLCSFSLSHSLLSHSKDREGFSSDHSLYLRRYIRSLMTSIRSSVSQMSIHPVLSFRKIKWKNSTLSVVKISLFSWFYVHFHHLYEADNTFSL